MTKTSKNVAFIGYDGVEALDLVGPLECFHAANGILGWHAYKTAILGLTAAPFKTESGTMFSPQDLLRAHLPIDTVIIPGGKGLRQAPICDQVARWLNQNAPHIRRIASVCTGIYGLAASGLLDGREVTTHWRFLSDVAQRYPAVRVIDERIFVRDGKYYTSAGVLACIDLALAMIEDDLGARVANDVSRALVVHSRRPAGQAQFSEALALQSRAADCFPELAGWILSHLRDNLSVSVLAARAALSQRQFSRRFRKTFETTPRVYVERIRLEEADRLLKVSHATIDQVADACGYLNTSTFRQAYLRRFNTLPHSARRGSSLARPARVVRPERSAF